MGNGVFWYTMGANLLCESDISRSLKKDTQYP